jgi:hypothetical protein
VIHLAEPDRGMRRSLHRAPELRPIATVELEGKEWLVGVKDENASLTALWKIPLDGELLDHLAGESSERLGALLRGPAHSEPPT